MFFCYIVLFFALKCQTHFRLAITKQRNNVVANDDEYTCAMFYYGIGYVLHFGCAKKIISVLASRSIC